jgi:hypothetical protein
MFSKRKRFRLRSHQTPMLPVDLQLPDTPLISPYSSFFIVVCPPILCRHNGDLHLKGVHADERG